MKRREMVRIVEYREIFIRLTDILLKTFIRVLGKMPYNTYKTGKSLGTTVLTIDGYRVTIFVVPSLVVSIFFIQ